MNLSNKKRYKKMIKTGESSAASTQWHFEAIPDFVFHKQEKDSGERTQATENHYVN